MPQVMPPGMAQLLAAQQQQQQLQQQVQAAQMSGGSGGQGGNERLEEVHLRLVEALLQHPSAAEAFVRGDLPAAAQVSAQRGGRGARVCRLLLHAAATLC